MVATPKNATCVFRGVSGITYVTDMYNPDVAGSLVRWDAGGGSGAATPDFVTFSENVVLEDLCTVTGIADTTRVRVVANSTPTGHVLRWAQHLDSLNNRPKLTIGFRAGTRIQMACL
jgi:hypothetical protein